ncbi:oxygenase MpaB family protein [Zavarzinia sp.]|uniref:oxygenase MpaB family protein n=1 Tax=Zavarzinia sp. TaxID=2027920 RepID=UPI0035637413
MPEAATIPKRHAGPTPVARRAVARLKLLIRGNPEPSVEDWRELGQALTRGDPAADALVAWMADYGPVPARALFERALAEGIDALPDAPVPLRDFFRTAEADPPWLDRALLERGAEACRLCGNVGSQVLRDGALMGGYQAAGLNRVLMLTGALEKGAGKRIAETSQWWMDCTAPGGMACFGTGWRQSLRVRLVHTLVRRHVAALPGWDPAQDGTPINQMDMAATQLAFSALFLVGARALGILLSAADGRAVMHLMRYAGWLMGIEERFLPDSEQEGRRLLYQMGLSLTAPDDSGPRLARALADEPLGRPYPRFRALRRFYERERNLSINRFFVGGQGMSILGLPWRPLPWYPVLALPVNTLRFLAGTRNAAARQRFAAAGRLAQEAWVASLVGAMTHEIGGAVRHITEAAP